MYLYKISIKYIIQMLNGFVESRGIGLEINSSEFSIPRS